MEYERPVNMSSLDVVRAELGVTLNQATDCFEEFLSDTDNVALLRDTSGLIWQIAGTLELIEIRGAALLARAMYDLINGNVKAHHELSDRQLEALSTAFFILPRYLESVAARKNDIVLMLLPQVNVLRIAQGKEILFEHSLVDTRVPHFSESSTFGINTNPPADPELADTLKRLRHMYQVGLLGVVRDAQVELHVRLMARALQRLCRLLKPGPSQRFWLLASAALDCFQSNTLRINNSRKHLFRMLDKHLRNLAAKPERAGEAPDVPSLEKELYYLLQISGAKTGPAAQFIEAAGIQRLAITDAEVQESMQRMFGPGLDAMSTVAKELRSEVRNAMDILEILMQSGRTDEEEVAPLQQILRQLAGVLNILGLPTLADYLGEQIEVTGRLVGANSQQAEAQLPRIADAVLFIEHSLDRLDNHQLSFGELDEITPERQREISTSSQLEMSKWLVYKESEAGINLSKRAISSYVDSEFDVAHIYNVGTTLNTIRGAFQLLKMPRITAVLTAAVNFINDFTGKPGREQASNSQLLETLADALISVEYYLTELVRQRSADDNLLTLAEESLEALGYRVAPDNAA